MKKGLLLANDSTYVYNLRGALIEALINENYKVYVGCKLLNYTDELTSMGVELIDISIGRHGKNPFNDIKLFNEFRNIISNIKPDVVLTYNIKPNTYGGLACAMAKVKYLANITGLGTPMEYPGFMQFITTNLIKIGLSKADTVFFQNSENQKFFEDRKLLNTKTKRVLLPGSGVNLMKNPLVELPGGDTRNFLYVARIMEEKGIDIYLQAAKTIRETYNNAEFHICGYCDDEKYQKILDEYVGQGIIHYHGEVKDTHPYYANSHCVIHPSYYPEGMSNVLLEAAACGRAIICANRSGCRETVDDGVSGFVVPIKDIQAVIDKVVQIMNMSNSELLQMGLNGRRKIEKEFDRQIVVEKYMREINA